MSKPIKRSVKGVFAAAALGLAGCVSVDLNPTAQAMSAEEYRQRIDSIEPGDSYKEMLGKLNLTDDQFQDFSASWEPRDAYNYAYGQVQTRDKDRLKEYDRLEAYSFQFRRVREKERFGILHNKTKRSGNDLFTVILLRDGNVMNNPRVAENEVVNGTKKNSNLGDLNPLKLIQ